ncbi:hypothetical protein ACUHMQ_01935 [Chitinimonas sp. PSY-7]|uniref:hypothetical protein n=1 Tax=Chitinimonas sp. PSY-7 TaxID=3459088 RepID=UPI0040400320
MSTINTNIQPRTISPDNLSKELQKLTADTNFNQGTARIGMAKDGALVIYTGRSYLLHPEQTQRAHQFLRDNQLTVSPRYDSKEIRLDKVSNGLTNKLENIRQQQVQAARDAGLLGLAVSPTTAGEFAEKVVFDGIGRIVGLKAALQSEEVQQLQQKQTTSLTQLNAAGPREAPKTEAESLITFVSVLRNAKGPEAAALADRAQTLWLSGKVNTQESIALYTDAVKQLQSQPELCQMAETLLVDAQTQKMPGQYIDSLFGRYFDSEFAHELVRNPSSNAKETSAQIGQFLVKEFDDWFAALPETSTPREKRLDDKMQAFAKEIQKDTRPWFSQVPEVAIFLAKPSYENFTEMMTKVDDGFGMIKVPFLAVKMATTEGMGINYSQWKMDGDRFYQTEITKARSTGDQLGAGTADSYQVKLKEQKTSSYGTMLPHQPIGQRYEAFQEGRNVAAGRILAQGKETLFEKNALAQGLTVVSGTSGSTNIMAHLDKYIASKMPEFSEQQAYLNTLAFLVFDGGHSVNESLVVYQALNGPVDQRKQILNSYTANYRDLVSIAPDSDKEAIGRALGSAFDKTLALHQQLQQQTQQRVGA